MAPFTVTPMPGSITAIVSPNETTSRIGVSPLISLSPWRAAKCIATSPIRPSIT